MTYDRALNTPAPAGPAAKSSPACPTADPLPAHDAWAQRARELLDLPWDQPGPVVNGALGRRRAVSS